MGESPLQITLGDRTYQLEEQRIGRIGRKLGAVVDLFALATSGEAPPEIGPRLRDALQVFIPDIDPLWKLAGYPSAEAYEYVTVGYAEQARTAAQDFAAEHLERPDELPPDADWQPRFEDLPPDVAATFEPPEWTDPYDEAADKSPRPSQLIDAVEKIFAVHGGDRVIRLLKNFVSPEMIRAQIKRMQITAALKEARSLRSSSELPGNGASGPTSSSTPALTSELASLHD